MAGLNPTDQLPHKPRGVVGGWLCLSIALILAVAPIPVLLLWLIPAVLSLVFAVLALSSHAPVHGSLILVGVFLVLPLAWMLGMLLMMAGAGLLFGGNISA